MPGPGDLLAQIEARRKDDDAKDARAKRPSPLAAMLQARNNAHPKGSANESAVLVKSAASPASTEIPVGQFFRYDASEEAFLFDMSSTTPHLTEDKHGNAITDIVVPLAPCVYRMTDYTISKQEPITLQRCLLKLNVLRCLARECAVLNKLLWQRFSPFNENGRVKDNIGSLEDDELGKARFMELLSNCGVYQKVSELVLQCAGATEHKVRQAIRSGNITNNDKNPYNIPQIRVEGLADLLDSIEELTPTLKQARDDIEETQTVSFYPGLGELFSPGSKLLCYPEGMEGSPLGCSCVQSWYTEDINKATDKVKRRFVLVVEFIVSVGDEVVFVAASEVYPEFHDPTRNVPLKDLAHRRLLPETNPEDAVLLTRLQQRGEFYASVATHNHYLEYHPHSFFPIIGGGWNSNAVRPLSKGGRVMVDVKRGILEGHIPVRGSSDGMSDTVKEAIKLFEQSKRTGVVVPFRTAILPGFENHANKKKDFEMGERDDSDRSHLWQSWPILTGFSFTARVWGKLLLGMPKFQGGTSPGSSLKRMSSVRLGVQVSGLGGQGSCGNVGYITFQEQAFEQLVLAEDKKELIRAVARNAGGAAKSENILNDDDDEDEKEVGIDVIANKGGASIFLLHGPPGCGKTLTAEAISELLRKPLYIVTAGDLGTTAAEVEKSLGSVLDLCQTWDALVLIDEADIFLEARNSSEIQRNALVCVMLRLLEYYSGCLFLSSNRAASSIDAAIASRITVMLGYPPLDAEGRAKVWKNLIELVPTLPLDPSTGTVRECFSSNPLKASRYRVDFSGADYSSLAARYQLNGRQIKNSIVLARALARERRTALSLEVLQRAVTAVAGEEAAISSA